MTNQEALGCLDEIAREIEQLRTAIDREWQEAASRDATQAFLRKCGGWEDARSPEEIVAEIYSSRTASDRGADTFGVKSS